MTSELRRAFDPVADVLQELDIRFRIGGSVASSALGVGRSTLDVDVVADIRSEHVEQFVQRLADRYYVDSASIREAIAAHRSFNLIHLQTMLKIDVFVLGARPYDRTSFERATLESIGGEGDRAFPITTAEDVVLRKLEWFVLGDRVSDRQWRDVVGVLRVQGDSLDRSYMRRWASELGLVDLLDEAIAEASP
ncbi:MAG: hypothetical protein AAF726_03105 [Planctomycetota bacterium]